MTKSEPTHFKHDAAVAHLMAVPVPPVGGWANAGTEILGQISSHAQAPVQDSTLSLTIKFCTHACVMTKWCNMSA